MLVLKKERGKGASGGSETLNVKRGKEKPSLTKLLLGGKLIASKGRRKRGRRKSQISTLGVKKKRKENLPAKQREGETVLSRRGKEGKGRWRKTIHRPYTS